MSESEAFEQGPRLAPRVVPRWCGVLLMVLGLLTLPWIAGLALVLPSSERSAHYDVSWVGFDVLLCVLLLRTGWLALRRREQSEVTAAMAGTLLIVDAWFDVLSAPDTAQFLIALAMAVLVELPLAGVCLWICARVEIARRRRETVLAKALRGRLAAARVRFPGLQRPAAASRSGRPQAAPPRPGRAAARSRSDSPMP
jgi:hypothetical protein